MKAKEKIYDVVKNIEGWLSYNEGKLLYKLARNDNTEGVIVEIGSWRGKSTICLAMGSKDNKSTQVYAIDPHINREENYKELLQNIEKYKLNDIILMVLMTMKESRMILKCGSQNWLKTAT